MDTLLTEVVLFPSLNITLNLDRQYFSLFRNLLKQVGGGSFHPSTLISATQLAVAVAEEVLRLT